MLDWLWGRRPIGTLLCLRGRGMTDFLPLEKQRQPMDQSERALASLPRVASVSRWFRGPYSAKSRAGVLLPPAAILMGFAFKPSIGSTWVETISDSCRRW